jgi:hypothetical protein
MIPYHTHDPRIPNAGDEKWWLRANATKYLAGTCACRSCRLTSGFEIQTWAFVPRANIYFHVPRNMRTDPGDGGGGDEMVVALDFDVFREGEREGKAVLKGYESSEGVMREFCGTCGATVFWHDKWRPEVVDVSVGLLDVGEGARAEGWLEWWGGRVSFEGDAVRDGDAKGSGEGRVNMEGWDLIPALGRGLRAWDNGSKGTDGRGEGRTVLA